MCEIDKHLAIFLWGIPHYTARLGVVKAGPAGQDKSGKGSQEKGVLL